MKSPDVSEQVHRLLERTHPDGGFGAQPGAAYRPDATAWGALCLNAVGYPAAVIAAARSRLSSGQLADGRVGISPDHPEALWPTPLAILAWHGSPVHRNEKAKATAFLLNTTGNHWQKNPASPHAHDPSLRGWPWTDRNHSWIEPTSLSLIALRIAGYGDHARVAEGAGMLLDRQLSQGGWNVGSKAVYGREPRPFPDCTGLALAALAGQASKSQVRWSIDYLKAEIRRIRSPLSLGWGLMGLGAWDERPREAREWIGESLELQVSHGPYDTSLLSLLLLAFLTDGGLAEIVATGEA